MIENGAISVFNTDTGDIRALYSADFTAVPPRLVVGDKHCKQPPRKFFPHGIDLLSRTDDLFTLYVVNHGERDSVQIFELAKTESEFALSWRGCVNMAQDISLNDVAALPDGGFVTTANPRVDPASDDLDNPWKVLRWQREQGLSTFLSLDGGSGNGISASKNGTRIYVSDVKKGRVIKVSVKVEKL